jgi:hypothetical protein
LSSGGSKAPTNANSADGEVLVDIEVGGGVAAGAHLVVYFATNTDQDFQDATSTAIHDTTNNPSVILHRPRFAERRSVAGIAKNYPCQ